MQNQNFLVALRYANTPDRVRYVEAYGSIQRPWVDLTRNAKIAYRFTDRRTVEEIVDKYVKPYIKDVLKRPDITVRIEPVTVNLTSI